MNVGGRVKCQIYCVLIERTGDLTVRRINLASCEIVGQAAEANPAVTRPPSRCSCAASTVKPQKLSRLLARHDFRSNFITSRSIIAATRTSYKRRRRFDGTLAGARK